MSVYRKGLMAELMGRTNTMIQAYTSGDVWKPDNAKHPKTKKVPQ